MENKKTLFMYGVIAMFLLVTGTYTQIINYASAVPTVVSMAYGNTCATSSAVTFKTNNLSSEKAWFVCTIGGVVTVLVKHISSDSIIATIPLGSTHTSSVAIAYVEDFAVVVLSTNDGYAIIDEPSNSLLRNVTSTAFDDFLGLYYHRAQNVLYGFTSAGHVRMSYNDGALSLTEISTDVFSDCETTACQGWDVDETNGYVWRTNSGGDATDSIFRIDTDTQTANLELVLPSGTPWDITVDEDSDVIYVSLIGNNVVRKYSYTDIGFALLSTPLSTITPRSLEFDTTHDTLFVIADVDDTVRIVDGTANTQLSTLAVCTSPIQDLRVKTLADGSIGFLACLGTTARIIHSDIFVSGAIDDIACLDVNFDGVADVCYEDINGDGIPDASPLELIRSGQNVTESANNIACQIGIETACDNPDPKTNGVGFLLVIVLLAFMIVLFAMARLHTNLIVPEWLWIIGTFTVLGASIFLGWIDTTLFIIGVIVIIAMASFKIVAQFVGSDF